MAQTSKKTKESLKAMKEPELRKKLLALEESLRVIRFKAEGAKSKNVKEAATLKKQIAQVLTMLNQFQKKDK
jgi:ribosomal protein L29